MSKLRAFYKKYQMIIFTALAVLICAGGVLAGYLFLNRMEKALWNQLIVDLTEVTYQGGHAFETYEEQEQEVVKKLAEGMSEFDFGDEQGKEDALSLLEFYALGDGLFSLITYDDDGGTVYVSGEQPLTLNKSEIDELLKDYGDSGIATYLNFYTGQLTLGHYQKFIFNDGNTAVIRKGQLMDYLRQEFSLSFYNETGFSYITDISGKILIRPTHKNSNRTAVNLSDLLTQSGGTDAEIGQLSSLMAEGMRGALRLTSEDKVLAFVPLESVGCYLISIVPNSSIMNHVDEVLQTSQTLTVIVIIVFIIVIIFALATYFYRRKIMAGEREVKYREQLFGLLASNTDDIYILMSLKDFSLEYVSPNSQRVLGVTQKDIQSSLLSLISQDKSGLGDVLRSLSSLPDGGSQTRKYDRMHKTTGEIKHFVDTIYHTTIDNVDKLIIILSDRTAEIQSETALKDAMQSAMAANEAKSVFLSNMSHDIRTPMNAILGFTELIKRDAGNADKVSEYTDKISSSGQHLLGLINDILDMSKIENGKFVLSIEKFNLTQFIEELDSMMRPQAEKRKQSFEITSNFGQENLFGDKLRINQILINILSNAIKYTPEGGKIAMDISELPRINANFARLKFTVTDNGIGMSEEYRENLFKPFTREISSTVNAIQGTGLGMAITKNLVDLMSGTIAVKSKQGVGSTFTVELELRIDDSYRDAVPAAPKKQDEAPQNALEGKRFLAAEDNELNSEILVELLDIRSSTCEVAENGKIALEMFEKSPEGYYDGILMDIQMPVMNGYEAAKAIRSLSRPDAQTIPIIAMTANAFSEDINNSLDAGMDAHIAKPLDMDKLESVYREILNNRQK